MYVSYLLCLCLILCTCLQLCLSSSSLWPMRRSEEPAVLAPTCVMLPATCAGLLPEPMSPKSWHLLSLRSPGNSFSFLYLFALCKKKNLWITFGMLFAFLLAYLIFLLLNGDFIVLMINEMWVADYICLFCFWKVKLNELNNNNKKKQKQRPLGENGFPYCLNYILGKFIFGSKAGDFRKLLSNIQILVHVVHNQWAAAEFAEWSSDVGSGLCES